MKKFLIIILSLILALLCVGCASTYTPEKPEEDPSGTEQKDPNGNGDEIVFTVTLTYNGQPFYPMEDMYAQWIGDDGVYNAKFDVFGIARTTELDGDYRVTLSNVPSGYTYDPNNHYADNDNPDITIEILKLVGTWSGYSKGSSNLNAITISQFGTYRAILEKNQTIWFQYMPKQAGEMSIQSWVDIVANEVNPRLSRYNANFGGWWEGEPGKAQDDGGSASSFTKNFRMDVTVTQDMVGQDGQGNIWLFKIYADVVNDVLFPVIIDFTISFEREADSSSAYYETVVPRGPYATDDWWAANPRTGTFTYTFQDTKRVMDTTTPLGEIRLNPDDGFYHVYNDGQYGKVIFAVITNDNLFLTTGENSDAPANMGFIYPLVNLKVNGKNYSELISVYAKYCKDGKHPLNEELKVFLHEFAINEWIFADGEGSAESMGYASPEENMWLFACGYYK